MSNITIKDFFEESIWDSLVLAEGSPSFLQSWAWGEVQQRLGLFIRHVGVYKNNELIGLTTVITVKARRGNFFLCPHGPIMRNEECLRQCLEALIDEGRRTAYAKKVAALRIAPALVAAHNSLKVFKTLGFRNAPMHIHAERVWVLPIRETEDSLLRGMRKTTRHAIQKSDRAGVNVHISHTIDGLERFFRLYRRTASRHQFVPFPESMIRTECDEFAKRDSLYVAVASRGHQDLAAGIFIRYGDSVFYHHGASVASDVPAAHGLLWESIRHAKILGAKVFNFWGIAPDDASSHPFHGITVFKQGFGGNDIKYIPTQDYPLSLRYVSLWVIDTVRKNIRGF